MVEKFEDEFVVLHSLPKKLFYAENEINELCCLQYINNTRI